jgi:hypothetical protein
MRRRRLISWVIMNGTPPPFDDGALGKARLSDFSDAPHPVDNRPVQRVRLSQKSKSLAQANQSLRGGKATNLQVIRRGLRSSFGYSLLRTAFANNEVKT